MTKITKKQEKVWAYLVKHPTATAKEVSTKTKVSYGYAYKLINKIGTPKEVLDSAYALTYGGKPVSVSRGTEFDGYALNNKSPVTDRADARMDVPRETETGLRKLILRTTRQDVLQIASDLIAGDRAEQHGDAKDNFALIATYWNAHLGLIDIIKTDDVPIMLSLMKIARLHGDGSKNMDNYIDVCGYMALAGEISQP